MDRSDAHPAGQIRPLSCPECTHQGLHYYTDLGVYDEDRNPDQESILPRNAPRVPGPVIDANLDVLVCSRCGFVDFRRILFDVFSRRSLRVRNTPTPALSNARLGSP